MSPFPCIHYTSVYRLGRWGRPTFCCPFFSRFNHMNGSKVIDPINDSYIHSSIPFLPPWCQSCLKKKPGHFKITVYPTSTKWENPKNMGKPPKSSILIGFSIIFTIHFGGKKPYFWFNTEMGKSKNHYSKDPQTAPKNHHCQGAIQHDPLGMRIRDLSQVAHHLDKLSTFRWEEGKSMCRGGKKDGKCWEKKKGLII